MNVRKLLPLLLVLFLPPAARAAQDSGIEFSGVLIMVDKTTVHLASKASGQSLWIAIGETFDGYVATAYEAKTQMLVLTKDGATLRVHLLNDAKVKAGNPAVDSAAIQQAVMNNLRTIGAAADQFYLQSDLKVRNHLIPATERKTTATMADLVGTYLRPLTRVDGEDYSKIELKQGKPITITTASGITVTLPQ